MGGVDIRSARNADIPALIDLFTRVVGERAWLGTEPGFDRERLRAGYERTLALPDYLTLVADAGGAIAGTLRLVPLGGTHGLGMLIAADRRGAGLGTRLVDGAIEWARAQRIATLSLGVFPHNVAALRLYENAGFRVVGRRNAASARQTGEVWDIIDMELDIGPHAAGQR